MATGIPARPAHFFPCPEFGRWLSAPVFPPRYAAGRPEDIDKTLKLGTNVPMGPLTLAAPRLRRAGTGGLTPSSRGKAPHLTS